MTILFSLFIEVVLWILYVFGFILMIAVRGLIFIGRFFTMFFLPSLVLFLAKTRHFFFSKNDAVRQETGTEVVSKVDPAITISNVNFKASNATSILSNSVQIVPLEDVGNMTIKVISDKGIAQRSLVVNNPALAKVLMSSKILLSDLPIDSSLARSEKDNFAYKQSILDVQELINAKLSNRSVEYLEKGGNITSASSLVAGKSEDVKINNDSCDELRAHVADQNLAHLSVDALNQKSDSQPLKPRKQQVQKYRNGREYYGRFISFGKAKKTGESYKQFFVEFYDDSLGGAVNQVWGNDLRNAIDIVKPKDGEFIRIKNYGFEEIQLPSGQTVPRQKFLIFRE